VSASWAPPSPSAAVAHLRRYVMTRAFLICCVVALTGGVPALHPQNARAEQTLRIEASTAERHAVRVNDGQDYRVTPDGGVGAGGEKAKG
jgi:hypothetical protein